jgi:hypothetical protein
MVDTFHIKKWSGGYPETISGSGSMMKHTENVRENLPKLIEKYQIKSIFDAPCGDRNWIKHVDFGSAEYFGGDVVPEIVREINLPNVFQFDIRKDTPPKVDLWFCRDCLYHLSEADIRAAIKNMMNSDIKYFLITSHLEYQTKNAKNKDIGTGDYRCLILKEYDYFGMGDPIDGFVDCYVNLEEEMLLFKNSNQRV